MRDEGGEGEEGKRTEEGGEEGKRTEEGGELREEEEGSGRTRDTTSTNNAHGYLPVSRCSGITRCSEMVFSNHSNRRVCECEGVVGCFFCTRERNTRERLVGGTSGPWCGGRKGKEEKGKLGM